MKSKEVRFQYLLCLYKLRTAAYMGLMGLWDSTDWRNYSKRYPRYLGNSLAVEFPFRYTSYSEVLR